MVRAYRLGSRMKGPLGMVEPRRLDLVRGVPIGEGRTPPLSPATPGSTLGADGSGGASGAPRRPQAERLKTRSPATRAARATDGEGNIKGSKTWPHHNRKRAGTRGGFQQARNLRAWTSGPAPV